MNLTEPVNSDLSESALCSSELLRGKSMMMKNIFSQLHASQSVQLKFSPVTDKNYGLFT